MPKLLNDTTARKPVLNSDAYLPQCASVGFAVHVITFAFEAPYAGRGDGEAADLKRWNKLPSQLCRMWVEIERRGGFRDCRKLGEYARVMLAAKLGKMAAACDPAEPLPAIETFADAYALGPVIR